MPISAGATQIIDISPRGGHPVPYGQQMVPMASSSRRRPMASSSRRCPMASSSRRRPMASRLYLTVSSSRSSMASSLVFHGQQQPVLHGQQQPAQYHRVCSIRPQVQPVPYGQPYDPSIYAMQQAQQPSYAHELIRSEIRMSAMTALLCRSGWLKLCRFCSGPALP